MWLDYLIIVYAGAKLNRSSHSIETGGLTVMMGSEGWIMLLLAKECLKNG